MKKNRSDILIILIFFIFIYGFSVTYFFISDKLDNTNTENRELASKPEFKFSNIFDYPKNYENYYNDHLPFRNQFRSLWTKINQDIFNVSVDDRVIIGHDGWLFYTGDKTMEQLQGISSFDRKTEDKMIENLEIQEEKLNSLGMDFYILVLPNKENIYRDYLPDVVEFSDSLSRTEKLIERIKDETKLNIIYPKEELYNQGLESGYSTYYKHDTHWNEYGGFIGFQVLNNMIQKKDIKFDVEIVEQEKKLGDLTGFANLNGIYKTEIVPVVNKFMEEVTYRQEINNNLKRTYNKDAVYSKRVLFVGDSFREAVAPYFQKTYEETMFLHNRDYNSTLLKEFKPDIVVFETVERFSYLFVDFEF